MISGEETRVSGKTKCSPNVPLILRAQRLDSILGEAWINPTDFSESQRAYAEQGSRIEGLRKPGISVQGLWRSLL